MAGRIHFCRRFRERKIARPEARLGLRPEERTREIIDGAFEVAESNVGIHREAFDLMEHVAVRRVGIVAAIHFARHNDPHGRLFFFHRANLHRRSVRAQQIAIARAFYVEGVHVVARRVVFGNI